MKKICCERRAYESVAYFSVYESLFYYISIFDGKRLQVVMD